MKKICITLALILIIALTAILSPSPSDKEYLRIHIRANSNSSIDQAIKYEIKQEVVNYLTPFVAKAKSKAEAINAVNGQKNAVNRLIEDFLIRKGFRYGSKCEILNEEFPTRCYQEVTLEAGYYDALIITLGQGAGDNWWCVVYPPLCFTGEKVEYRSLIYDIFNKKE